MMGELDDLEEIELTASVKSKYSKRSRAYKKLQAIHNNTQPKWKSELTAQRVADIKEKKNG